LKSFTFSVDFERISNCSNIRMVRSLGSANDVRSCGLT